MDNSSILCEVKCPLILLLRRDPLKKFRNVLKMKKRIRSLAKPLIHLSKFKFDFTKKIPDKALYKNCRNDSALTNKISTRAKIITIELGYFMCSNVSTLVDK